MTQALSPLLCVFELPQKFNVPKSHEDLRMRLRCSRSKSQRHAKGKHNSGGRGRKHKGEHRQPSADRRRHTHTHKQVQSWILKQMQANASKRGQIRANIDNL